MAYSLPETATRQRYTLFRNGIDLQMMYAMTAPSLAREPRASSPNIRRFVICVKTAILLCLATSCAPALAFLTCVTSYSALTFTLPTGAYAIPRDKPTGTRITPFTSFQTNYPNVWSCTETMGNTFVGPVYQSLLSSSGQTYSENGVTYQVFNTNLAGVGLIMQIGSNLPSGWYGQSGLNSTGWQSYGSIASSSAFFNYVFGPGMAFAFVKTGPITPGTVSLGAIAHIGMSERPIANVSNILPVTVTGNPVFTVLACTTPNITVNLGTHRASEFSGPNTFTSSVNFNLALNNCPTGMNTIRYQVDAVTPIVNAQNSVVALDASSTASGVGLQLLNGSGTPFPLGSAQTFSGYNSGTGGSYTIPFRARYYQTGSAVGPGRANSVMTFTMTYQ
ncbi:fimbrial protein [Cupriavidus basilensis]|uniref:Fimbrial protein n=1 Tax=Cupriavidus basilensis TaxID=68895 RepID=A0ABT6B0N5_9BURK|nr:fimbrial protein [Cupriavidus basilensis]MDF3838442.1 fimbrial protein [Cupriavidus basilensis]